MKPTGLFLLAIGCAPFFAPSPLPAQISIIQNSDGTSGTVTDLGNGFRIYSDSHGNSGTIIDLGGGFQSYSFTTPQGHMKSGSITTFGTPSPPGNLTPAPVLPFTLGDPIMPREQVAPVVPFTPSVPTGPGSGFGPSSRGGVGRFGR